MSWADAARPAVGGASNSTPTWVAGATPPNPGSSAPIPQQLERPDVAVLPDDSSSFVRHVAGKLDCLPACAILTLCPKSWVGCCSSCIDTVWCCVCCRFVSHKMLSLCLSCSCGEMCAEHCLSCKCFACDKEKLAEPSCCEATLSCILVVPFALIKCMCMTCVPPGQPTPAPGQPVGPPVTSAEKKTKALREKEHAESARLNSSKKVNAEMSQRPGNVQEVLSEAQDNDYNLLTDDSVR
ncbi:hypothetical protein AB1Y20_009886 [Prymnesium parvum]|uniref:Uncharacterized protein n=1 Tax=Prymnesium parvum TaxID=97485 RepID=A0AB34K257_PRYPA